MKDFKQFVVENGGVSAVAKDLKCTYHTVYYALKNGGFNNMMSRYAHLFYKKKYTLKTLKKEK